MMSKLTQTFMNHEYDQLEPENLHQAIFDYIISSPKPHVIPQMFWQSWPWIPQLSC